MANIWQRAIEQGRYLLKGPGSNTSNSTALISIPPPTPPLRTSLVFESHIQEAGKGSGRNPQTISSAWDERMQYGDTQRSWQGLTPQERKLIMLDIYLNNPWVSACIDVIAKRIFSGGYVVEKIDEEAPDNHQHEDQMHEFALRINPDWDFNQLGRALLTDEQIFGESYAEMTWKGGLPWQLFKVDCIPMGYKANRYGQIEQFYQEMESTRERIPLDINNIIRWWFPHPRASIDPFAPSEKVSDAIVLDKKMMVWTQTFFQKGTKFPFSVKGVGDQDEADRFLQFFRQNFTGEKNAHVPFVTWGNAELVWNAAQKLDMDFQQGLDRMRTIVFGAFGVPPAAVSIIESGNIGGGTGEDQDKSLIFNACDPVKQPFFEKLNDRIVKRGMGITDYRYSARYAEYRSDESIAKVQDIRAKNGTRSIDELRQEDGKRPYKRGGDVPFIWSSKEIVPVPRLDDMEDEQRATAQVTLDTAKAGADLAQTKAKQAKEPPPEPVQPPAMLPPGQQSNQPGKPVQGKQKQQKPVPGPQEKQQEAVQLSLLDTENEECNEEVMSQRAEHIRAEIAAGHYQKGGFGMDEAEPHYFTGKTELPQWVDPDQEEQVNKLIQQGVIGITWEAGPNPCRTCLMNHGVTVKTGMPFPSGHLYPQCHPNCDCGVKQIKGPVQEQEDKDATQKLPVVKVKKPQLTENDTWEGRMQ